MRPMNTRRASVRSGSGAAASPGLVTSGPGTACTSIRCNHHIARLDHHVGVFAGCELEVVDGLVGNRRSDHVPTDIHTNVSRGRAFPHLDDFALQLIPCTEPHSVLLGGCSPKRAASCNIVRAFENASNASRWPSLAPMSDVGEP